MAAKAGGNKTAATEPEPTPQPKDDGAGGNDDALAKLSPSERAERDIPPLRREQTPFVPKVLILRAAALQSFVRGHTKPIRCLQRHHVPLIQAIREEYH